MRTADGYIINKCLNGDSAAFGLLVDKYRTGVYALAYSKLRDFHDAEDVAQEVFIKAYRKLRTLRQFDSFHAWLYAITSNLCKDWLRARARRPDREFIEDQSPEVLETRAVNTHREELVYELIHEAMDSLSETYQQVLTLYYLGGMNSREIAEFLGTSPAAIRERLSRARSQLKEGILAMMSTTFETQKLHESFTFRIVEAVKQIKIQPMPKATGLPWGLSLAAGFIIAVISLSPYLDALNPMSLPMGSPLPSEMKVLKTGEMPVDVFKISQMPVRASKHGEGDGGKLNRLALQNDRFLAPRGEGNTWARKADMPTARWGLSASVVDGKIYAIGGCLLRIEEYDPEADTWLGRDWSLIEPAVIASTSTVDGIIYIIGGQRPDGTFISATQAYKPVTNECIQKADIPTPRYYLSTSVVNGKIYAIGGYNNVSVFSAVEEYDPVADMWTKKASMPTARLWLSTSVMGGKIYAIGGSTLTGVMLSTMEEYDPATDTWTKKNDMPTARYGVAACAVNGKIYAIGGRVSDNPKTSTPAVEVYDPVTDTWTKKADMAIARDGLSATNVDGKIYAIGGWNPTAKTLSVVEEYTPEGWPFAVFPQSKLPMTWGEVRR